MNPLRSVAAKVSLLTCLFVLSVIALMAQRLLRQTETALMGEMKIRAEFFARSSREAIFPKVDPFALHFAVEEVRKEKAVTYAAVLDPGGKVLSHSDPRQIGETLPPPETASRSSSFRLSAPILVGARPVGTVQVGFDRSSLDEALRAPKRQIALIASAAVTLAVLGTVLIVGWIMRPLPRLAAAAREVGRGNFNVQVEWRSSDEIGVLARAFNEMTIANDLLFKTIRQEAEKLERIFHETREGMLWVDSSGRILLINPSARTLLGCAERAVTGLSEACAQFKVEPPMEALLGGENRITPFELRRSQPKLLILSGVADRLGEAGGQASFLFVFHDATLEKKEAMLSRNFLALVSHKLRTPLTVALGFLEIVQSDSKNLNDFQKKALAKVKGEDEKLRSLVEKLITFSTVQSPENISLEKVEVDLGEVAAAALKTLEPSLLERKVRVLWSRSELSALPRPKADPHLVKEALVNLLENAVKFNAAPSPEVRLSAAVEGALVRLSVADNGPGIPSEEQPKLFRKFYQIDADFTGQIPGMGLGLAFVKSIAEAHGGGVRLRSEPSRGSEFSFTLPL
jgi:PAS domain S-box-containing protein